MTSPAVLPPLDDDIEVPARPDQNLDETERDALRDDLERIARLRRDTETEGASLRLS